MVGSLGSLQRLLGLGAPPEAQTPGRTTPLMAACVDQRYRDRRDVIFELLRRTSDETRRVVNFSRDSAIDLLAASAPFRFQPWQEQVVAELLSSGAPVKPVTARRVLPIAVSLMQRKKDRLAWLEWEKHWDWRGHDEVVGLVYDLRYMQEDEGEEAALLARVEAAKAELRELGEEVVEDKPIDMRRAIGGGKKKKKKKDKQRQDAK